MQVAISTLDFIGFIPGSSCRAVQEWGLTCSNLAQKLELVAIKLAFPARHDDRRHAVADHVDERTRFAHEAVDAEDQGHAGHRNGGHDRQRSHQAMNEAPWTPLAPFDVSIATPKMASCCMKPRSMLVACATNSAAMVI